MVLVCDQKLLSFFFSFFFWGGGGGGGGRVVSRSQTFSKGLHSRSILHLLVHYFLRLDKWVTSI